MVEKKFINAQELATDSFTLGMHILESGFKPDFIIGIWRGGTPVGIVVQELLDYYGITTDHIAIRTSAYDGMHRHGNIRVHGLDYIIKRINDNDNLLLVDDVFDTGLSVKAVIDTLTRKARKNTPKDIRVAVVYYKPSSNQTNRVPDYFIHETDRWLVFPHELKGLTQEEIRRFKPTLEKIIGGDNKNENNA